MRTIDNQQDSDAAIATNHWPYPEDPASPPIPEATVNFVKTFRLQKAHSASIKNKHLGLLGIGIQRSDVSCSAGPDLVGDAVPAGLFHCLQKVKHTARFKR
jgi:hypothetical protein